MQNRQAAEKIFMAGVRSVLPEKLITRILRLEGQVLKAGDYEIPLEGIRDIYVIGAGKASAAMGHYVEAVLGARISGGHIVVKYDHSCKLKRIEVSEAGHPVPDENGFRAAVRIREIAEKADENDLVICLLSGGGSSLMADIPEGLLPEELYIINNLLIRSGASINEINCVRKHISGLKGGQLARIVWPARLLTLIISDVIGDPPEVIASGPTVPDPSTFQDALRVIEDFDLKPDLTAGLIKYLSDGAEGLHPETPKPGDPVFEGTVNILAGTNITALQAASAEAGRLGYRPFIIDNALAGDVEIVSESLIAAALSFRDNNDIEKPVCLLYGGETTIKVTGRGVGGRNQHLALSTAMRLMNVPGITVLAAGTDGTDGSSDAAGAVVDSLTVPDSLEMNLDPESFLSGFDSYNFFRLAGGQIVTGPTYTNVMDLVVILID